MKPSSGKPYSVQPIVKALQVLELVAERGHDVSLNSVCAALHFPKTTTFRYLQTLSAEGFLHYDRVTERYSIGSRFRVIAQADISHNRLRQVARPRMVKLLDLFNETINLAIREHGRIVYIDIVEARRSLRFQARVGDRHPLHSTALGKAMLSVLPDQERRAYFDHPLAEMASRTLIDRDAIERQLRTVTRRGYATETEENEDGAFCVGAPILNLENYPIAAISISAPIQRMSKGLAEKAGKCLAEAARRISEDLRS
jgi:IclR family acetate operon transcriptional repressor